jgi:Helix-turn-helix domain
MNEEKETALRKLREKLTGTDTKTQCQRLLEALSSFPVTTFEAMRYLDIYHVPARVLQLRKAGHPILTLWQNVTTEAGAQHRVGLYVLRHNAEQGGAA